MKNYLLYKERCRELLATVSELDEEVNSAATSRVLLGNDA
jgi:hypothetical protein